MKEDLLRLNITRSPLVDSYKESYASQIRVSAGVHSKSRLVGCGFALGLSWQC